jgi:phage tail-like protein
VAVYGANIYGTARFGLDPNLARPDFSVAPFVSTPLNYTTLHLTWRKPQSTQCTILQLVINSHNLPQDETDGLIIFNQPVGQATSYTDVGPTPGFNYYTMWGWDAKNLVWVRCTDLIALLPINWGYGNRMYELLPGAYRDQDFVLVDPYNPWAVDGSDAQPPLQRYLAMLGFELDFIRTELESLTSVNDALNCSGALLPLLAFQVGLPNEPEIGMQQERQLIANAIHLYKLKGSPRGITEFASIMTSYPMAQIVHHGYNLMLTRDDSVMDSSIGTWQSWPPPPSDVGLKTFPIPSGTNSGLTLTQIPNLLTVASMTNPTKIIGFQPPVGGNPPPYNNTGMRAQVTLTSVIDITTDPIPVLDFLSGIDGPGTVTFQIQVWSSVARSVELSIWGDVGNGSPIAIGAATTVTSTLHDWKQFQVTATLNPYTTVYNSDGTTTVTTGYYWIYPRLRIISAAGGEAHYITLGMIWPCPPNKIGVDTPVYDYPRDTKIILSPQGTNLLSNPLTSFGTYVPTTQLIGFDGWSAALDPTNMLTYNASTLETGSLGGDWGNPAGCTIAVSHNQYHNGNSSVQMTSTVASGAAYFGPVSVTKYSVVPAQVLTATAWALAGATAEPCCLTMNFYNAAGGFVSGVTGTAVTDVVATSNPATSVWTEVAVTGTVPANAAYVTLWPTVVTVHAAGEVHYWDDLGVFLGAPPPVPTSIASTPLYIHYTSPDEPPGAFTVHGIGSLQVNPVDQRAVVWAGEVLTFTQPPPTLPAGWWADPNNDWFGGATLGPGAIRPWMDPASSTTSPNNWFFINQGYFYLGTAMVGGNWFVQAQPPQTNNVNGFAAVPGQLLNFSIYARYMNAPDPSMAAMRIGLRWYFPDGTWYEDYDTFPLTQGFVRYQFPPDNSIRGETPVEQSTNVPANQVYPFIRFPQAGPGTSFLLNSAMLAPGATMPDYMDFSMYAGNPDYTQGSSGATYYYRGLNARSTRLRAELYRFVPMGSSYTVSFGSGNTAPPLDPTLW